MHLDEKTVTLLKDSELPEAIRVDLLHQIFADRKDAALREIELAKFELEKRKLRWSTPIVATITGIITLGATYIFNIWEAQTKSELSVNESEIENQNAVTQQRTNAELAALSEEKAFQYEIVRSELTKEGSTNAERAEVLLFLTRAGILSTLNEEELITMATEQQENPSSSIIPRLSGTLNERLASAAAQVDQVEKELLSVPEEALQQFAGFLTGSDGGIIKLLPRGRYEDLISMRGGGAYYSFANRTHEYGYGSDIQLSDGELSVGFAGVDYGFFLEIGNVEVDALATLTDAPPHWLPTNRAAAWLHMFNYIPPKLLADGRLEQSAYSKGVQVGENVLSSRVIATVSNTYLLRSINEGDADNLIALKIVDKLPDDSLILIWRILKSFPPTEMTGPDLQQ